MTDEEIEEYYERELTNDPYAERHYYDNQQKVEGIPINPVQRYYFDMTPHDKRNKKEVDDWWEQPFIVTESFGVDTYKEYLLRMKDSENIETEEEFNKRRNASKKSWEETWQGGIRHTVRCLDGGAWDRSTWKGAFNTMDDALALAESLKDIR